jgi:xanthine dehydrogenase YagS FAD-binding subunit
VYPGDWAVALVAFDAEIDVLGSGGERTIKIEDLHRAPGATPEVETVLAANELILRIRVPATPLGRASTYHKIRDRESYAFALASAAVAVRLDGGLVREARIALGGVATRPWRARDAERVLVGEPLTGETARAAGAAAFATAVAGRYNAYKIKLGARTVADALLIAGQRAGIR